MNKWDARFMQVAFLIATWSSCIRKNRQVGALIVKNKRILTTGYNGMPAGLKSCAEMHKCIRDEKQIPSGTQPDMCYAVHAEQNAIAQAAMLGTSLVGATIYCTHQPCCTCSKIIINCGITRVVYFHDYPEKMGIELLKKAGIEVVKYGNEA